MALPFPFFSRMLMMIMIPILLPWRICVLFLSLSFRTNHSPFLFSYRSRSRFMMILFRPFFHQVLFFSFPPSLHSSCLPIDFFFLFQLFRSLFSSSFLSFPSLSLSLNPHCIIIEQTYPCNSFIRGLKGVKQLFRLIQVIIKILIIIYNIYIIYNIIYHI